MKKPNLVSLYISKIFLIKFFQLAAGISLLIFFTNLTDVMDHASEKQTPLSIIILMSFLQIPDFLNDISSSLVLIAAVISFFILSSRSELNILRAGGFSLWQIIKPIGTTAFLLGIFWITAFNSLSILMIKTYSSLEREYVEQDTREYIAPPNGVWIKQTNIENPEEEIIIQTKKVYKDSVEFNYAKIWFFDKENEFYKKIDAKKMFLIHGIWHIQDAIINDSANLNKIIPKLTLKSDLEEEFILKKVINNFQNTKLFSIFEAPGLITNLRASGFSPVKFEVYFHSLLSKPLSFLAMTLIACFFGLNHIRDNNAILMIFLGIVLGIILFIISGIINALGSSGLISIFASTWVINLVFLSIGILLIYRKEHI